MRSFGGHPGRSFGGLPARSYGGLPARSFGGTRHIGRAGFHGGSFRSIGRPNFRGSHFRTIAGPGSRGNHLRTVGRHGPRHGLNRLAGGRHGIHGVRHAGFPNRGPWRGVASRHGLHGAVLAGMWGGKHHGQHHGWNRHWRHGAFYGWLGPVFWPYAYYDVFAGVYWPGYYDPFWDYGYDDLYAGLFWPYAYDDYAAYPQQTRNGRRVASRGPAATGAIKGPDRYASLCGDDSRDIAGLPIDQIRDAVSPTEAQRADLDKLGEASVKAAQIIKAACPTDVALTSVGRLDAMKTRIDAMLEGLNTVRGPLETFYNSLSDEQKARFNRLGADTRAKERTVLRNCGSAGVPAWPAAEIEKTVRPTAAQTASLEALKAATQRAAEQLKASCSTETPITPTARLAAMSDRLTAMRNAVQSVSTPLADFYNALSDEQKAKFNAIGRDRPGSRSGTRQTQAR
jgi:hypothetical protein